MDKRSIPHKNAAPFAIPPSDTQADKPAPATADELVAQLRAEAPREFSNLVERLGHDAELSKHRLGIKLRLALSKHDLTRQELLAAQRDIVRLARIGAVPGPTEYWQRSALPRASALVDESMIAVVDEGAALGESIDQFLLAISRPPLTDWADRWLNERALRAATAKPISCLVEAVPPPHPINALGTWWQHKLHQAAVRQSIPKLLTGLVSASGDESGKADVVIGQAELALLDGPPWSHGDRLLSAFELAHGEIRTQTELVAEGLTTRVASRGRTYLRPSERVTIELRH